MPNRQRLAPIRVTSRIDAPSERVFSAWLDAEVAAQWLFATASRPMTHVEIDPRVGGCFCLANGREREINEYRGRYIEIVPSRRLVFDLRTSEVDVLTRVCVEIGAREKRSYVRLIHENLPHNRRSYFEQRWTGILYGLGVTLADRRRRSPVDRAFVKGTNDEIPVPRLPR